MNCNRYENREIRAIRWMGWIPQTHVLKIFFAWYQKTKEELEQVNKSNECESSLK